MDVSGKTEIDGGTIVFEKFGAGGIVRGDLYFFTNGVTIGDGVTIDIASDLASEGFTFDPSTGIGHSAVPEPASIAGLALGLVWLAQRRKARR